jgi:heterotetrameric sarcosine oxidase gamma subunit
MSEVLLREKEAKTAAPRRQLPLLQHVRPGRYGAERADGPSVTLSVRHPLSIVTVIARKGQTLSAAFEKTCGAPAPRPGTWVTGLNATIQWCAPNQYYVVAEARADGALYVELKEALVGLASVSDQSHGRVVLRTEGAKARHVLAKGSAVDFHPRSFPPGSAAATQMAHIGVHVVCVAQETYELSLFRGFSENFWEWLTEQAAEFGYEVR